MCLPDEASAREIARSVLGEPVRSLVRFPTGLQHWVYDVVLDSGRPIVLRIASPTNRAALVGAVYWHARLQPLGVPLAALLHADLAAVLPFLVLERLPGTDLGHVYGELSVAERRTVANRLAELQKSTARLPEARGFGYALDYDAPLARDWPGVLRVSLKRGRAWIERGGVVEAGWADRVEARLGRCGDLFEDVRPRAFLHDVTTKNVIIHEGVLAGIVDVDSMAFGDPLWTVALTRMSLLAAGQPTDYIEAWCAAMGPAAASAQRLDLYTALHGLGFLGELGQTFNREASAPVDPDQRARLEETLNSLLGQPVSL